MEPSNDQLWKDFLQPLKGIKSFKKNSYKFEDFEIFDCLSTDLAKALNPQILVDEALQVSARSTVELDSDVDATPNVEMIVISDEDEGTDLNDEEKEGMSTKTKITGTVLQVFKSHKIENRQEEEEEKNPVNIDIYSVNDVSLMQENKIDVSIATETVNLVQHHVTTKYPEKDADGMKKISESHETLVKLKLKNQKQMKYHDTEGMKGALNELVKSHQKETVSNDRKEEDEDVVDDDDDNDVEDEQKEEQKNHDDDVEESCVVDDDEDCDIIVDDETEEDDNEENVNNDIYGEKGVSLKQANKIDVSIATKTVNFVPSYVKTNYPEKDADSIERINESHATSFKLKFKNQRQIKYHDTEGKGKESSRHPERESVEPVRQKIKQEIRDVSDDDEDENAEDDQEEKHSRHVHRESLEPVNQKFKHQEKDGSDNRKQNRTLLPWKGEKYPITDFGDRKGNFERSSQSVSKHRMKEGMDVNKISPSYNDDTEKESGEKDEYGNYDEIVVDEKDKEVISTNRVMPNINEKQEENKGFGHRKIVFGTGLLKVKQNKYDKDDTAKGEEKIDNDSDSEVGEENEGGENVMAVVPPLLQRQIKKEEGQKKEVPEVSRLVQRQIKEEGEIEVVQPPSKLQIKEEEEEQLNLVKDINYKKRKLEDMKMDEVTRKVHKKEDFQSRESITHSKVRPKKLVSVQSDSISSSALHGQSVFLIKKKRP